MGNDPFKPEGRRQLGAVLQKGFGRIAAAGDDFQRSGHASALHSLLRRETGLRVPRAFLTTAATGDVTPLNEMAGDYLSASQSGDAFQLNRITGELDGARVLGGLFGGGGGNPPGGLGSIGGGAPARGCVDLAGNRNGANPACHMGNLGGMPGGEMHRDGGGSAGTEAGSGIWDAISSGYGAFVDGVQNAVSSVEEGVQEAGEWASDKWDGAADWFSQATGGQSGADGDASGPGGTTQPGGGSSSGGGVFPGGAAGDEAFFQRRFSGLGDGNGGEPPLMGGSNQQVEADGPFMSQEQLEAVGGSIEGGARSYGTSRILNRSPTMSVVRGATRGAITAGTDALRQRVEDQLHAVGEHQISPDQGLTNIISPQERQGDRGVAQLHTDLRSLIQRRENCMTSECFREVDSAWQRAVNRQRNQSWNPDQE